MQAGHRNKRKRKINRLQMEADKVYEAQYHTVSVLNKIDKRVLIGVAILVILLLIITSSSSIMQGAKTSDVSSDDSVTSSTYTITIEYLNENLDTLSAPYVAELPAGTTFYQLISSPTILGYTPYYEGTDEDATIVEIDVENIDEDITIRVVYIPNETTYLVKRYLQNVYDGNYTLYTTEVKSGIVGNEIDSEDLDEEIDGFTQQIYETTTIAADGSTVINIYYDRNYYLISFDLQGGYGVNPIYAQYGTSVSVTDTPTKAGYTFIGWDLDGDGIEDDIVRTVPAENITYTAMYEANETTYTVVYWLEDANEDGEYDYWGSEQLTAVSGTTVNGSDRAEILELTDYIYATYETTDTNVVVEGDGSSIVNVYYTRNEYTLRFFYAKESNGTYYVCNSTDNFTKYSSTDYEIDDLLGSVSSWKEVTEIPTLSSEYSSQTEISTGSYTSNGSIYYYFEFTAKYEQDITNYWPCDNFETVTSSNNKVTYLASWGPEKNIKYTFDNTSNPNIKGIYTQLDSSLLYDESVGTDSDTVCFLGYWCGGGWSTPVEWQYTIYIETDEGTYEIFNEFSLYLTSTSIDQQTAIAIEGYTENTDLRTGGKTTETNSDGYTIYTVSFYYDRNSYTVELSNVGTITTAGIYYYNESLEDINNEPDYPSEYEEGIYVFVGWYTTADCLDGTEFDFENDTMPANDLILYAKWEKISHTVTLYYDYDDYNNETNVYATEEVAHGEILGDTYDDITRDGYTFVGWFYIENGEKQIFSLSSMQVNEDLVLYAEWIGTTVVSYKISYMYIDEDGNEIEVAEATTGLANQGVTKIFSAKTGSDLYEEYQEGYFPSVITHAIYISYMEDEENEYTFYYTYKGSVEYTVEYRDASTGELISTDLFLDSSYNPDKENPKVSSSSYAIITETFTPITGYLPTTYQQTLILQDDASENVLIFYYTANTTDGVFLVSHYLELLDGSWNEVLTEEGTATLNSTLSREAETFTAYTFNADISTTTGTVTEYGLHLQLYYNLNEYEYTVQYLLYGTDEELADSVTSTAKYTSTITEEALEIEGYDLISSSPKSILINTSDNTITFYYIEEEEKASITITKVLSGDTSTVIEGAVFAVYELICVDSSHEHDTDDDLIDVDDYDETCWELIGTYTSDENGEFTLSNLPVSGNYRLVEIQTADNSYLLPTGQWKIEFDHAGNLTYDENAIDYGDTKIKITAIGNPPALSLVGDTLYLYNSKGFTIPISGGLGVTIFKIIGLALAIIGISMFLKRKRGRH